MTGFYYNTHKIYELKKISSPALSNLKTLLNTIKDNTEAAICFYERTDFSDYPNPAWLELLKDAGEFDELKLAKPPSRIVQSLKAGYLEHVAETKPDKVIEIITSTIPQDVFIQSKFLQILSKLPIDKILPTSWFIWHCMEKTDRYDWYLVDEHIAKIMVEMLGYDIEQSLTLASALLRLSKPKDKDSYPSVNSRFREYEYNELVFKYCKLLWEKKPAKTARMLVAVLERYLAEIQEEGKPDASELLHITIDNLDCIDRVPRDVRAALIQGICDAGELLVKKERKNASSFLDFLESFDRQIFNRLRLYLLRFLPGKTERKRIEKTLRNPVYLQDSAYRNEYRQLLLDKAQIIDESFIDWFKEQVIDLPQYETQWFEKYYGRKPKHGEIKKDRSRTKADLLYLVKDVSKKWKDLYSQYKKDAEATDDRFEYQPSIAKTSFISPTEGSPISVEEMLKMSIDKTLGHVLNPKSYDIKLKQEGFQWRTPKQGLEGTFQKIVKKKAKDFVCADIAKLKRLDSSFLASYFNGLWEGLREGEIEEFNWKKFLSLSKSLVNKYAKKEEFHRFLYPMLNCIREGFGDRNKIAYSKSILNTIYTIIKPLFNINEQRDQSHERDPVQTRCNTITGEATLICLSLGIICKQNFKDKFENDFRQKVRTIFDKLLNEVKTSWTCCTFGSDFSRIYWLDPEWVENSIESIFSDELWDTVWNTYLTWGRPSRELFDFLNEHGIYSKAIEKIDSCESLEGAEKHNNSLADQIVIAYFNGWLEGYNDRLLLQFVNKAPDDLLDHTADFITTGFESLTKEPDEEISKRIKDYWTNRLNEISRKPQAHANELNALACWVENSPLKPEETLRLTQRTIELCNSKFKQTGDYYKTINSLCDLAELDMLTITKCICKIIELQNESQYFSFYKGKLTELIQKIKDMGNTSPEITAEAIKLVDMLGRLHIYDLRDNYNHLKDFLIHTEGLERFASNNWKKFPKEAKRYCDAIASKVDEESSGQIKTKSCNGSYSFISKGKTIAKVMPSNPEAPKIYAAFSSTRLEAVSYAKKIKGNSSFKKVIHEPFIITTIPKRTSANKVADILTSFILNSTEF